MPFNNTAWIPFVSLPSVMAAKATFFCLRTDLIQPQTVTVRSVSSRESRSCLIVGDREKLGRTVESSRRTIMGADKMQPGPITTFRHDHSCP